MRAGGPVAGQGTCPTKRLSDVGPLAGGRTLGLLQVTRLATLFEFFEDEETAVNSFA